MRRRRIVNHFTPTRCKWCWGPSRVSGFAQFVDCRIIRSSTTMYRESHLQWVARPVNIWWALVNMIYLCTRCRLEFPFRRPEVHFDRATWPPPGRCQLSSRKNWIRNALFRSSVDKTFSIGGITDKLRIIVDSQLESELAVINRIIAIQINLRADIRMSFV